MIQKIIKVLLVLLTTHTAVIAQPMHKGTIPAGIIPQPVQHTLVEYTFDSPTDATAWNKVPQGLNVSFATTDELFFRAEVPLQTKEETWTVTGWRGERLNTQLLLWSPDTLDQVRVSVSELKSIKGSVIPAKNWSVDLVRYVVSNYPYGDKTATCGESPFKEQFLMPDRFEKFDRFQLPGNTTRPVWLSVNVPQQTPAGEYTGTVTVRTEKLSRELKVSIKVQDQILPLPRDWKHRLDLWQNPWVVAWQNNVEPWTAEHMALLKKHMQPYADAGGTFITTYAIHSPWSDNSHWIEGGMIDWVKTKNGSWKFDYSIFDKWVNLCMDMGIDEAITIYSPVPWGYRHRYMDEATGNFVEGIWPPESDTFKMMWNIFLTDLQGHLQEKGWFERTYIGINENALNETLAAIDVVKKHNPNWKITYAGDWHPELENLLDDYCFLLNKESGVDIVDRRRAKGFTTTYYVCCNPPYPNNFLYSPPIEGRWLSWYSLAHNYDGFLRWAYDAYPADPNRDSRHTFWPSGDCYLVYPGGNSCIRFEKLREGFVDFEKVNILRSKAKNNKDKETISLLKQLDALLNVVLKEKEFNAVKIAGDIARGRSIVEKLSDRLK